MQGEVISSIIAAATALAAVIASPFLAARTSKNQMIGPMRQAWINDLRDNLSEYISHLSINRWHTAPSVNDPEPVKEAKTLDELARIKEAIRIREKIFLLLNPKEHKHITLSEIVQTAFNKYEAGEETGEILVRLRQDAQYTLKAEWDVVRGVKPTSH